jgi:hypothetical protein
MVAIQPNPSAPWFAFHVNVTVDPLTVAVIVGVPSGAYGIPFE